jgi:hypothetical protein
VAIDWDRLEAEIADLAVHDEIADDVVRSVKRRRRRRALIGAAAVAVVTATVVPAVLLWSGGDHAPAAAGRPPTASAQHGYGAGESTRAAIYTAALAGGSDPQPLHGLVYVRARVCVAVAGRPRTACGGHAISAGVQAEVRRLLGPQVRFVDAPPDPEQLGDPSVVTFGRLQVRGAAAQLGMQVLCGPLCGQGTLLVLKKRAGHWQVTGTTGPRWIS